MKTLLLAALGALTLSLAGCGDSTQRAAYENAVKLEKQLPVDRLGEVVPEYQKVIRLAPDSNLAHEAQSRLDAVQARIHSAQKTEELNQSVFHQTGID
jgi:type IV pilus biogenesis protein CpaD/CtpE